MPDIAAGLQRLLAAAPGVPGTPPGGFAAPVVSVSARRGVIRVLRWPLARLKARAAQELHERGVEIIRQHPELFGGPAVEQLETMDAGGDPQGGLSIIVQQRHGPRRVPVRGGAARFHADDRGVIDLLENRLFIDLAEVPGEPRLSETDAVEAARAALAAARLPIATAPAAARESELLVVSHQEHAHLAWRVWLREVAARSDRVFVADIDAANGRVLDWYDATQEGAPAQGTGRGRYAGAQLRLQTWREGPQRFELRDVTRTPLVIITHVEGERPGISTTTDNSWTAPERHVEADAHHFAGLVVDYFRARGERHRKLGHAGKINLHVHAPFAIGGGQWDPAARIVRLSDGDDQKGWGPCSSLDWVAHELVHSYTQATCDLTYRGETGALNEAISDTFAALIRDAIGGPVGKGSWGRFKESWRGRKPPVPYRNMADPHNGETWSPIPQEAADAMARGCGPRHLAEMYRETTEDWDHGGVHVNSAIINHLFYLLAKGGTNGRSKLPVEAVGNKVLEDLLFRCMERHLPADPDCDFRNFRRHMVAACLELFPRNLLMLERLKHAFRAVGIGPELIVRDSPNDKGLKPVPPKSVLMSPDVINRQQAVARPSDELGDAARHNLSQDIHAGRDNFVYVRVRNTGSGIGDASVGVSLAPLAQVESPTAWRTIPGDGSSGKLELAIGENELRVVGPFVLKANRVPASGNYCLIAMVSSAFDPVPPYHDTQAADDYLAYLRNTNNVAGRKVKVTA